MGLPETSRRSLEAAFDHAACLDAPMNLAYAYQVAATAQIALGDGAEATDMIDSLEALARRHGFAFYESVWVPFNRTFIRSLLGDYEGCLAGAVGARSTWQAIGMSLMIPEEDLWCALALGMLGRIDEALERVESALAQIARPGWNERCVLSELLRVKGWLLEKCGALPAAESVYREALEVARAQSARTHELRTATWYARMLRGQGRHRDALDLLAPVHGAFTEGFETRDVVDAGALLRELEGESPR